MSFSKINVGKPNNGVRKRGKFNHSCDSSFTSNFGDVIVSYAKEYVPNSHINLNIKSLVRTSPLTVPTFGRMSLKHFTCFVKYSDIYPPFEQFISNTNYLYIDGGNEIPEGPFMLNPYTIASCYGNVGFTSVDDILDNYTKLSNSIEEPSFDFSAGVPKRYYAGTSIALYKSTVDGWQIQSSGRTFIDSLIKNSKICVFFNHYLLHLSTSTCNFVLQSPNGDASMLSQQANSCSSLNLPTFENSDNVIDFTSGGNRYRICVRYGYMVKKWRTICVGLGIGADLNDTQKYSILPILAYYKAWFSCFGIERYYNFNNTYAYNLIQFMRNHNSFELSEFEDIFISFIEDVINNTYYTYSPDCFTSQIKNIADNQNDATLLSSDYVQNYLNDPDGVSTDAVGGSLVSDSNNGIQNILGHRFLRYVNVCSVIGQNILNYFKTNYGVVPDVSDRILLHASKQPLNVQDVMSLADTSEGVLGDYAGKAIADPRNSNHSLSYDVKHFGILINLSVIVPEVGYYQGRDTYVLHGTDRFDYYNPEFDSIGYRATTRQEFNTDMEYMSTLMTESSPTVNPRVGAVIGLAPRYMMDYKVKNNIVNGELRWRSTRNTYSGYYLDRNFGNSASSLRMLNNEQLRVLSSPSDPFNLNRIFNNVSAEFDHFIVHNVFDVTAHMPMIPVSDSFVNTEQSGTNIAERS